jgi:tetratricopeptide (TPR) repeat protein
MLLKMADCYVRLDRLADAGAVYRRIPGEAFDPEHAEEAAFMVAEVEFFRGRPDSAKALYQTMAETYPRSLRADDAAGRYVLLNKYAALGGGEAVAVLGRLAWGRRVGNAAVVDSSARFLVERYPGGELAAEAHLAQADMAGTAGDPSAALAHLDAIVNGMPTERRRAEALVRQADILVALGRSEEALGKLETLLADHPASIQAGEARRRVEALRRELKS